MRPPRLLRSDPNLGSAVRADLDQYSRTLPSYDAELGAELLAKKLAGLDAGDAPSLESGATAGSAVKLSLILKSTVAIIGGAVFGAVVFRTLDFATEPPPSAARAPVVAPVRAPEAPKVIESEPPPREVAPIAEARSPRKDARSSASRREIAQLMRVRELLDRDPAAAYRLAQASSREFPTGALREEREGLSIIALFTLGQDATARSEAMRFLARYPESPLRDRIERSIAGSP